MILPHSDGAPVAGGRPALDGLRVLDLSQGIPGAVATLFLAGCGADVVKVEPTGGDVLRPTPGFATWNRSKRGAVLDLDRPDDRAVLDGLLARTDVLVHSFDRAAEARHGLVPDGLRARFPHLVVGRVRAFPPGHPDEDRPAWDPLVLGRLGLLDEQAGHRPGPVFLRFPLASWGATHLLAVGLAARLVHRAGPGRGHGGLVSTSLAQGALVPMLMHWFDATEPSEGLARAMPKRRAVTLFACADDRWIHVMQCPDAAPWMAEHLARLGPEGVAAANAGVEAHPVCPNQGANAAAFGTRPAREWVEHLWAHDVAAQVAVPPGEVLGDEQARANGYVVAVDDPVHGPTLQAGLPFHLGDDPIPPVAAPALGQHTEELRAEAATAPLRPAPTGPPPAAGPPLADVRVLDLGSYLAGPFGPMALADLGADVVKVEAPTGDAMRFNEAAFEGCQRGKRSVTVDLRDPAQRPRLEALVRAADVVHHNIRTPAARRLGVDAASVRAVHPDVVWCHVSSYGPRGPRADWPGFDQMAQAQAGWEVASAGEGNPPQWLRFGMMDHHAALASAFATLVALYDRRRTGRARDVSASLLGAAVLTTSETFGRPDGTAAPVPVLDRDQTGVDPACRLHRTADGWIVVADRRPGGAARVADALGAADPASVAAAVAARPAAEVLAALDRAGVPAEPVREDQRRAFLDAEAHARCRLVVGYPHARYGHVRQVGALWDVDDLPLALDRAAPTPGQHDEEVDADWGIRGASGSGHR